jgi:polysaccharide export outer membrane protein
MSMKLLVSMFLALTLAPQADAAQASAVPSAPAAQAPAPATPSPAAGTQAATPGAPEKAAPNYVIGVNDSLAISVVDDENMNLSRSYKVAEDGTVTMPYLGRIPAGGQTLQKFQAEVTRRLAEGYINNPQVRVDIDQYKSQSVFVTGAVRTPVKVEMQGNLTLMAALVQAGSPTSDAADEVQITHKNTSRTTAVTPDQADAAVTHVKLKDLNLGAGDLALLDGDIVFVPTAKHFVMTGQVRNPGSYVWNADLTVDKAIALAGGLMDRASTRGISTRRLVAGKMKDVDLNMQSPVLADDVIKIGTRIF